MTTREREILGHLAAGADTRTIANELSLSEHTVQDHLKSMFTKSDTRSRRELLARVSSR
jgi:DNA-binding CsgD family transcriptional regulator